MQMDTQCDVPKADVGMLSIMKSSNRLVFERKTVWNAKSRKNWNNNRKSSESCASRNGDRRNSKDNKDGVGGTPSLFYIY